MVKSFSFLDKRWCEILSGLVSKSKGFSEAQNFSKYWRFYMSCGGIRNNHRHVKAHILQHEHARMQIHGIIDCSFPSVSPSIHLVDLYGMNIMTLLPNYPSMPVKDPDNLLMAWVVVCLIAQLINLGVEKSAPRQLCVPLTILCMKLDLFKVKRETCCYQQRRGNGGSSLLCPRDSVIFGCHSSGLVPVGNSCYRSTESVVGRFVFQFWCVRCFKKKRSQKMAKKKRSTYAPHFLVVEWREFYLYSP